MDHKSEVPEVLQLFLQQPSTNSNSTAVFKLLSTSKAMQAAISGTLSGQLSLRFSSKDPKETSYYSDFRKEDSRRDSFLTWMRKHGQLLKSLAIPGVEFFRGDQLPAALAAAPNLQSYESGWDDNNSVAVLQALPAHSLTHLRVCMTEPMPEDDGGWDQIPIYSEADQFAMEEFMYGMQVEGLQYIRTKNDNAPFLAALSALTNLASLSLHGYETLLESSPVMAGLSSLSALTKLSIQELLPNYNPLKHLPAQLKELEIDGVDRPSHAVSGNPLAFGHLTALTRLHASAAMGWRAGEVCVGGADVLPPNLVSLCVSRVLGDSLQPLTALKSLKQLTLTHLPAGSSKAGKGSQQGKTEKQQDAEKQQGRDQQEKQGQRPETTAQECLPGVEIKVVPGSSGRQFTCHCCHPQPTNTA